MGIESVIVALVDDDSLVLKIMSRQLRNAGIKNVLAFSSAEQAMQQVALSPEKIDVLIADLQMPGIDGIELARSLSKARFSGGLIFCSAEGTRLLEAAGSLAKAHGLQFLGILDKPAPTQQLLNLVFDGLKAREASIRMPVLQIQAEELQEAIRKDELINHYQPQVSVRDGSIVGVEALVRWRSPSRGLVFPDQFIPLAESSGLIDELTDVVLSNTLKDANQWLKRGFEWRVATNVSMHNLIALDFPEKVLRAAAKHNVPLGQIILEVTETQLMNNPTASLDILARLRLKGISLSIDDFGTGFSSLAQLRSIPFNELKIDRSFVKNVAQHATNRAIVEASLDMAEALGMTSVAEGVETRADLEWLKGHGNCDVAQGYYIARPMSADDLLPWLERRGRVLPNCRSVQI